jgi:hypothetical protein
MSLKFKRRLFPEASMYADTLPESFVAGLERALRTDPQQDHPFLTRMAAGDLPNSGSIIHELTEMVRYGLIGHRLTLQNLLDLDHPDITNNAAVCAALARRIAGFGVMLGQLKECFASFPPLPLEQLLELAEAAGANLSHSKPPTDISEILGENLSHDPLWEWSRQALLVGAKRIGETVLPKQHALLRPVGHYWDPADWKLLVAFAGRTPITRAAFARGFCRYLESHDLTCDALYARCVAYDDRISGHSWEQVA